MAETKTILLMLIATNNSTNNDDCYQSVIEHPLTKVDFSVGTGTDMLRRNLNLSLGKTVGYNNIVMIIHL